MFAEWEYQKGIVLIYPHKFCDFLDNLEEVQDCYDNIITEILKIENLFLILHPNDTKAKDRIQELLHSLQEHAKKCKIFELESNDVWARDSIALSLKPKAKHSLLSNVTHILTKGVASKIDQTPHNHESNGDNTESTSQHQEFCHEFANFGFNGWGLKFQANLDNQLNEKLHKIGLFETMHTYNMILEGGSIDYNGNGVLLTNTQCLLEKNRNPAFTQQEIEQHLKNTLRVSEVLWLNHGFLLGDDTDSHIDTLARFINPNTIAYIQCADITNIHFSELNAMQHELEVLAKTHNFTLIPLPFCNYTITEEDDTLKALPASYVNFLFLNQKTLLFPTYNKPTDFIALETLRKALIDYTIIPINCEALIRQHGSLHCISMQIH